jgi:uncharacterized protein YcfJ
MRILIIALAFVLSATAAHGQTWQKLQAEPKPVAVRVYEAAGKAWSYADGKLLLVKDDELTILRGRTPIVIPKAVISKVETRRRDPVWDGMVIGALVNTLMGTVLGGWQGCTNTSECAIGGIAVGAGFGALIDWRTVGARAVYKAP